MRSSIVAAGGLTAWLLAAGAGGQQLSLPTPLAVEPDELVSSRLDDADSPLAPVATFEEQVAELVNVERWNNGQLPPFKLQSNLIACAEEHSQSMAIHDYFSHRDFFDACSTLTTRLANAGYGGWTSAAENIAAGYSTPAAVMAGWMASSGHRANILSAARRDFGVGYFLQSPDAANVAVDLNSDCDCIDAGSGETCAGSGYSHYWTQVFGARGGTTGYPMVIEREAFSVASRGVDLYLYQPPGSGLQMRFANETGAFSAPVAFANDVAGWQLSAGDGLKTVIAEVTSGSTTYRTCDHVWLDGSGNTSFLFADGFECDGDAAWSAVSP